MKPEFFAEKVVDLHNDTNFEKLASFAMNGELTQSEMQTDIAYLVEKQACAEDATFADPISRMFSVATPLEAKLSALYATKCASMLEEHVVDSINDACRIYHIDVEVPKCEKVANIMEDPAIMEAVTIFDKEWEEPHEGLEVNTKLASAADYEGITEYGTELDTCLAARAFYAQEPEDVEAIEDLAKIASKIEPEQMVGILHEIDSQLGLDMPYMQAKVGTPEYAVYEKVASENMVNLGETSAPLSVISQYEDQIKDLGVELDWDGESGDALQLQLEALPNDYKKEIASWVK